MSHPDLAHFVRKLESRGALDDGDCAALLALPFTIRDLPPANYLLREGDPPRFCSILLSGFTLRHKIVGDGGRQIVAMHIPGDAVDFQMLYLDRADHNVQTLTPVVIATTPIGTVRQLLVERPNIARAVLLDLLVEASIFREWIANVGRRDARSRLAHLLCELAYRLDAQGLGRDGYELPMTQEHLGDALGLTAVHVNRSIRALEAEGLIDRSKRRIALPDIERLRAVGDFNPLYLHLNETVTPA